MKMTWCEVPTPDEEAFMAIKAGVDALPPGAKMVLNSDKVVLPWLKLMFLELMWAKDL